jgi:two-component sensor histidine kinase
LAFWFCLDADPLVISTDIAVPLGLIVNEVVTNAIQHSRPAGEGGSVNVVLTDHADNFSISVIDSGSGPVAVTIDGGLGTRHAGLGTRIVEALTRQINPTIAKACLAAGYSATLTIPHSGAA